MLTVSRGFIYMKSNEEGTKGVMGCNPFPEKGEG